MIEAYDEGWPDEFQAIAGRIRQGLSDLALRIDHIGSTAVPGLAAKDIIDIQITVAELAEPVESAMAAVGYARLREIDRDHAPVGSAAPDTDWDKWYFTAPEGQRRSNTHVRVAGSANQRYALLFRDYLRTHADTAAAYAELKRRLAVGLPDPEDYPDVKDPAVDLIYLAAVDWAEATGWQPEPTDA